jgi:hypothetical protein
MTEVGTPFPPGPNIRHVAGMAEAGHAARAGSRSYDSENRAHLKAMRPSRFRMLRRLLSRLGRGGR